MIKSKNKNTIDDEFVLWVVYYPIQLNGNPLEEGKRIIATTNNNLGIKLIREFCRRRNIVPIKLCIVNENNAKKLEPLNKKICWWHESSNGSLLDNIRKNINFINKTNL